MEDTMPINMEGAPPNAAEYGGHPAPAGRALPNLINAVSMLKSKPQTGATQPRPARHHVFPVNPIR